MRGVPLGAAAVLRGISVLMAAAVLIATGCARRPGGRLVIGSKNFTEQIILAELVAQHIEGTVGVPVERRTNLGGTLICHEALRAGQIDLYVEYTGTALTAILHLDPAGAGPDEVYRRVREAYAERFNLAWTEPLGFNNTFAIVVRGEDARRLGIRKISDVAPHAGGWRPGFGYEFTERPDGYTGLAKTYGLEFGHAPRNMELGLLYRALIEHQVDLVAGNSTDGVLAVNDLVVLEDDRRYFPPYEAAPIVRQKALTRHPGLRNALAALGGRIDEAAMQRMNQAVDEGGRDPGQVAREFLGGLAAAGPVPARAGARESP